MEEELSKFLEVYLDKVGSYMEEVMVFIDAGYLHMCLKEKFSQTDLDYTKFALKLAHKRRLKRIYYYTAKIELPKEDVFWERLKVPEEYYQGWLKNQEKQEGLEQGKEYWIKVRCQKQYGAEQKAYWTKLQREQQQMMFTLANKPYIELRTGHLQFTEEGKGKQKGVDVLIALDMLRFALKGNYSVAILVSGDGDFADIVRMVKDEGRKVEIVTFPGTKAYNLQAACDESFEVTAEFVSDCWTQSGKKRDKDKSK